MTIQQEQHLKSGYRHRVWFSLSRVVVLSLVIALLGGCGAEGIDEPTSDTGSESPPATHTLNVTLSGSGTVSSQPAGIYCSSDCSAPFGSGSAVTLTATPSPGFSFAGWVGDCAGTGNCTVLMTGAHSVTATFVPAPIGTPTSYILNVSKSGNGTVTSSPSGINCGSTCSASYTSGTSVTLTAAPASGYTFSGWSGACSGTGSCTVSMTQARNVSATFAQNAPSSYTLSVSKSGSGTVTSSPSGINCGSTCSASYASGTSVTLTAAPASGYTFSGWSGGACSGTGSCTVSMTRARNITANFAPTTGSASVTLTWEAPNQNVDNTCLTDLAGYELHYGPAPENYPTSETLMVNAISCVDSGVSNACGSVRTCTYTVQGLAAGTWYFALKAFNSNGVRSGYSNIASKTTP